MMSSRNRALRLVVLLARGTARFDGFRFAPARSLALVTALLASACTSDEPTPAAQGACQPGQSSQCACGTTFGTVTCTPSATWGLCQCAAPISVVDAGPAPTGTSSQPVASMDAGASTGPVASGSEPLPCEVSSLLSARCGECHGAKTQSGAPMSLVNWSDLQKPAPRAQGKSTRDAVLERIKSSSSPMPPAPFPRLSAAEIAKYEQWLSAGAPKGSAGQSCQPAPGADAGVDGGAPALGANLPKPADCENTFTLKAHGATGENDQTKFKISSNPALEGNQYHCFYFKPPYAAGSGMLWYDSIIDNKARLHHWILYATENATHASGTSAACNAAEPGAYFVAGWAPGANNASVPKDAMLAMPSGPNAQLILEVHYYNDSRTEQQDGSGVTFCTGKPGSRPHTAAIHTLGSEGICVQPGMRAHEVKGTCAPRSGSGDIHITGVWPHMHKAARRQKVVIKRASGMSEVIHDEPFDFNSQIFFPKGDIVVKAGDTIETSCYYDNDTSQPIKYGERTQDEMCYAFVAAWPAGSLVSGAGGGATGLLNRCADELSILGSCNGILDAPMTVTHPP